MNTYFDVAVIGGGPAGGAAATRLARLGHSVCLIEKSVGGSTHSMESLSPGVWPVLDLLGASERILEQNSAPSNFTEQTLSLVRWKETEVQRRAPPEGKRGLLVERRSFDTLLRRLAKEAGANLLRHAHVMSIACRKDGHWRLEVRNRDKSESIECRYLIDASGKQGFLGRNGGDFGVARVTSSPATVAVCGRLRSVIPSGTTMVEAIADGWIWAAGLSERIAAAMVFTDPETLRCRMPDGPKVIWLEFLAAAGLAPNPAGPLSVRDATASYHRVPIGEGFLRAGEASYSIDPLSSTGVEKALLGGLTAGTVVHTILTRPSRAAICQLFYRTRQQEDVYRHAAWAAEFYREVGRYGVRPFWARRARLTMPEAIRAGEPVPESVKTIGRIQWPFGDRLLVRLAPGVQLRSEPGVVDDEIASVWSIISPALQRPFAFLDGIPVGNLLHEIVTTAKADPIIPDTRQLPSQLGRVWAWLIQNRILEVISKP